MGKYILLYHDLPSFSGEQKSTGYVTSIIPGMAYVEDENVHYNRSVDNNGYDYVDLALPSDTLWAARNIGATSDTGQDSIGTFFGWSYTEATERYTGGKYRCPDAQTSYQWCKYTPTDGLTRLELEDDAAYVNMGGAWRTPTKEQFTELLQYTSSAWTVLDGLSGLVLTSLINGNSIYIPASGKKVNSSREDTYIAWLWSATPSPNINGYSFSLHSSKANGTIFDSSYGRFYGMPVRGVISKE